MRKIKIEDTKPGVRLGKAIFSSDGRVLLSQGIELNSGILDKLREHRIPEIFIEDEISNGIEIKEAVSEQTRLEAKILVKDLMNKYTFTEAFSIDGVKAVIDKLIDELLSDEEIILNLSDIKCVDDYTFEHSVNVCIMSLIMGIGLKYNTERLKELGAGAILHDIGKMMIPDGILKKPTQLTIEEFEEIKKHTVYGYEILCRNGKLSPSSIAISLHHHERFDGSGYPGRLKGEVISDYPKIVAVADVYDALTSDRVYRKKLKACEVYEYITALGSHHFDQNVVDSFMKYVSVYPVGTGVLLNTKEKGLVVSVNRKMPTRPVVRVIVNAENQKLEKHYELDLSKQQNLFILDTCEI